MLPCHNVSQRFDVNRIELNSTNGLGEGMSDAQARLEQDWLQYGKWQAHGCFGYFEATILGTLQEHVQLYKTARLCNPFRMAQLQFDAADVRDLLTDAATLNFAPALGDIDLGLLIEELASYRAMSKDLKIGESEEIAETLSRIMPFWAANRKLLPTWCKLVRVVVAMTPSSAAAERIFSILKRSFGDDQHAALEDYRSASLMLQYNKR